MTVTMEIMDTGSDDPYSKLNAGKDSLVDRFHFFAFVIDGHSRIFNTNDTFFPWKSVVLLPCPKKYRKFSRNRVKFFVFVKHY